MTENIENLIAEAKVDYLTRLTYGEKDDADVADAFEAGCRAALGAVQPVTPDRKKGLEVLDAHEPHLDQTVCYEGSCYCGWKGEEAEFNGHVLDALLASGVLGQPQPQPDREAIARWLYDQFGSDRQAWDELTPAERYSWRSSADALLPLLGQPQPQPDREAMIAKVAAIVPTKGWTIGEYQATLAVDALLPLLGQPRTDTEDER